MRRISLKSLVCVFLFAFASQALAVDFIEVVSDDNFLIYVDFNSIEYRQDYADNYIVVWTQWFPRGETRKDMQKNIHEGIGHILFLDALNPERRQWQALSSITYGLKGNQLEDHSTRFSSINYEEIPPGSYGSAIYDFVIKHYRNAKKK